MEESKIDSFELRSEEVQEILTRVPHWLIRWGSVVVFTILLMLLFVSWLVKYPDIVTCEIVVTTKTPPQKLIAKTSGRIEAVLVEDKTSILKNTPLAVLENTANYKDIFLLKAITDTLNIDNNNFPFDKFPSAQFGDVESSFAIFQKEYQADDLNKTLRPYSVESSAQSFENVHLIERLNLLKSQKELYQSELELGKQDLNRYQTLYDKGIIASQELEKHKLTYLATEKGYSSLLSSISSLKSSLNDLNKNSLNTKINAKKERVTLERNVVQAFYQLKKSISDWELQNVFRSAIDGQVSYLQIWTKNQTVKVGDNVFAIIPKSQVDFIGKAKAKAQNSGKLKVGQVVNIRLENYPDTEYGVIKGKIQSFSLTPDIDGNILLDVSLPNGLKTSYNKEILFRQEMTGRADVITKDARLIERLLSQFSDLLKR